MKKFDDIDVKLPDLISKNVEMEQRVLDPELLKILSDQPEIEQDIVRTKDQNLGEKNKSKLCEEMNIESNAIAPFNPEEAIKMFLDNDLQKHCSYYDAKVIMKLYNLIQNPKISETQELLFWLVYLIKFEPEKKLETINDLRRNVGFLYSKMFGEIDENQECKEEILTLLQFVYGYQIHAFHYKLFPNDRKLFSIRFVQDCYHIVIYVMTGVLVTDYFIHDFLDKQFKDNFFQYQTDSGQLKQEQNAQEDSVFQAKMGISKEDFEDVRKRSSQTHEDYADSQKLLGDISSRFSKLGKLEHSKTGLIFNRLQSEMISGQRDISIKEDCNETLINRANEKKLFQTRSQETSQMMMSTMNPSSMVESQLKLKRKDTTNEEGQSIQNKSSTGLPSVNKKFKFDCAQISPGMQIQLSKGIANVNNKKKIGFSSYQIPHFSYNELSEYYNRVTAKTHHKNTNLPKSSTTKKLSYNKNISTMKKGNSKITQILRLAQAKFEDSDKYKHQDILQESGNMKSKFSEFDGIRCVLNELGQIKFPANERFDLIKKMIPKFPDHDSQTKNWEGYFEKQEDNKKIAKEKKRAEEHQLLREKELEIVRMSLGDMVDKSPSSPTRLNKNPNDTLGTTLQLGNSSMPKRTSHLNSSNNNENSRSSIPFGSTMHGNMTQRTDQNIETKANKTSNFGLFSLKQKVIEKKYFNIEEDNDDKYGFMKKTCKGKKHKVNDKGILNYYNNKKYYYMRYGGGLTKRERDVNGGQMRCLDGEEPSKTDRQVYGGKKPGQTSAGGLGKKLLMNSSRV